MTAETRERIERALQPLLGLPLWQARRAAAMALFDFGARQVRPARQGASAGEIGEYRLHIDCPWRLAGPEGIVVGSNDRLYRSGAEPFHDLANYHWDEQRPNRLDERLAELSERWREAPLTVMAVQADNLGGLRLVLTARHRLEVFPDDSLDAEFWRFFSDADTAHFVVTGSGANYDDEENNLE